MKKQIRIYLFLCVIFMILGVGSTYLVKHYKKTQRETEMVFWAICVQKNKSQEYSNYLLRFPQGMYADLAREKIREFRNNELSEWNTIRYSGDGTLFSAFISQYPDSPLIEEAREILDSIHCAKTNK